MAYTTGSAPDTEPNWQVLLPVARELERWLNALPIVPLDARETWEEFSKRQKRREAELIARLRRMPGCILAKSPQGSSATLHLAGVEVTSPGGLTGVCREWIAQVREGARRGGQRLLS